MCTACLAALRVVGAIFVDYRLSIQARRLLRATLYAWPGKIEVEGMRFEVQVARTAMKKKKSFSQAPTTAEVTMEVLEVTSF